MPGTAIPKPPADSLPALDRGVRQDLLVVGIGSPLRSDDRVGIELVRALSEHFGARLACLELYEPEIALAERIASFDELLVLDAALREDEEPFELVELAPSERLTPSGGLTSHVFDWGVILALAQRLYGAKTRGHLLGVAASVFELGEELSPRCVRNAARALEFLIPYCCCGPGPREGA